MPWQMGGKAFPVKRGGYVETVCKIGQGENCCRYLGFSSKTGWECFQFSPELKQQADERVADGVFTAQAINCAGKKDLK